MSSLAPLRSDDDDTVPLALPNGEFRNGIQDGPADVRLLVGHCAFGSPDAALLVALLPQLVHVRGEPRLAMLVQLLSDESRAQRPGREVILAHLLEVLLIEALRSMHENMPRAWTVAELAKKAALSRSSFFSNASAGQWA